MREPSIAVLSGAIGLGSYGLGRTDLCQQMSHPAPWLDGSAWSSAVRRWG
jgi:hypothetical protein